jgi:uncharacterized protein
MSLIVRLRRHAQPAGSISTLALTGAVRDALRRLEASLYARLRHPGAALLGDQEPTSWDPALLQGHKHGLLVSFRRNGAAVATPVWFGIDAGRLYLRSGTEDGKVKRIRRDPYVLVAPCTFSGRPLGRPMAARARILASHEERRAEHALRRNYGLGRWIYCRTRGRLFDATYLEVTAASSDRPVARTSVARVVLE